MARRKARDHLAQPLLGCRRQCHSTHALEHPVRLACHRLIGADLPAQLLQNVQHGEGPRRQQHRPGPQHGHAGVDTLGVAGVCGEDGDVFKSGAVQRLAEDRGVIGHAAVAAELGHAHGHGALRVVPLLQGVDQLADDHLAGEADVVVGVLLPHPDLLQRRPPAALTARIPSRSIRAVSKSGHRGGDIGHQHSPQLPVLLAVLDRDRAPAVSGRPPSPPGRSGAAAPSQ